MRTLKVLDSKGKYVVVRQLGGDAQDASIRNNSQIHLYFLSAKKGWRPGEHGSLWAYENSYVCATGVMVLPPKPTREVCIPGGSSGDYEPSKT